MTNLANVFRPRRFTGWHMAAIMVAAFGVIIAANATLAVFATASWPGLLVKNSYVESQNFERNAEQRRAVQQHLGWQAEAEVAAGVLTVHVRDAAGQPLGGATVSAMIGHPANAGDDHTTELVAAGDGAYRAPAALPPGVWRADVTVVDDRRQPWHKAFRFTVPSQGG